MKREWFISILCICLLWGVFHSAGAATAAEIAEITRINGGMTEIADEILFENPDMFAEDVTMELDEYYMDESGCRYSYFYEYGKMYVSGIDFDHIDMTQEYVEIRVPDKVIFDGKEYEVIGFNPSFDIADRGKYKTKFKIYIGRGIKEISCNMVHCRMAFFVHPENAIFSAEQGSLYKDQKKELVKFFDGIYTWSSVYTVPPTVEKIGGYAFAGTKIKEVVLGDAVAEIGAYAFYKSRIHRIDLNQVKSVAFQAFEMCELLRDLIISQEGVYLSNLCFSGCSRLRYVYLPANTKMGSECFHGCKRLEVVIMEEGCEGSEKAFGWCTDLRILILPETVDEFNGHMLSGIRELKILYLPFGLNRIEGGLEAGYSYKAFMFSSVNPDSPGKEWAEQYQNVTFKDLSEHEHQWRNVTFFKLDTWGITGDYCADCGKGEAFERVMWQTEEEVELPPLLQEEYVCPECLELNSDNEDELGFVYSLDPERKTATVISHRYRPTEAGVIPATVKSGDKIYTVEKIVGLNLGWRKIILPDTIKEVDSDFFSLAKHIKVGAGLRIIRNMDRNNASVITDVIEVSEDNEYFCTENNVLYNKDKTKLLYIGMEGTGEDPVFAVPPTVTEIGKNVRFEGYLQKVQIYNKENVNVEEGVFFGDDVEVEYLEWGESLDENNADVYGRKYILDENSRTATLAPEDLSIYEGGELTTPYKVEKDGTMYVVNGISFEQVKVVNKKKVVLKIEKYIEHVDFGEQETNQVYCDVNWENLYFRQINGTLLSVSRDILYHFYGGGNEPGEEYRLPLQVQKISDGAFRGANITAVIGGEQLTYIGNEAFAGCSYLEELKLQKDGMEIGDRAFADCVRLKNMYLPKNTVAGDGIFQNCQGLLNVVRDQGTEWRGEESSGGIYSTKWFDHRDMKEHAHRLRETTFFCYESWGVKGKYCEVCECGTNYELVTFLKEGDRELMPGLLGEPVSEPTEKPEKTAPPEPEGTREPGATAVPDDPALEPEESIRPDVASAEPSKKPTEKPEPTLSPQETPEETVSPKPAGDSVNSTEKPISPTVDLVSETDPPSGTEPPQSDESQNFLLQYRQKLEVKGFQILATAEKTVKLRWKRNSYAKCYRIYRASSKHGKYVLVKMVSKSRVNYVDAGVQTNKKYFYKISALGIWEKRLVEGRESKVCSIYNAGLRTPVISVQKGQIDSMRYVAILLKHYEGKNAEIYISLNNKKFKKLKLVSSKIARYKARFKIRYIVKDQDIRIKVRTYSKAGEKKRYSKFSKVVKVRV